MNDLQAGGGQSSGEHDAGWLELFSKRYWKSMNILMRFTIFLREPEIFSAQNHLRDELDFVYATRK